MANWGEFFSRLGGGLTEYAGYRQGQKEREEEKARQARLDAAAEGDRAEERQYRTDTLAATERRRIQDEAQHRQDQLYETGIIPPESYASDARAAALPETPGYDTGGMAINALRQSGRARTSEFEAGATRAQNELYKSGDLSREVPGGGRVFMEPGVRSNLDVSHNNQEIARLNRINAVKVALIRARQGSKTDPAETQRVKYMESGISRRMKPPVDPITGLPSGPAMTQAQAYKETKAEYDMVKGNLDVPAQSHAGDTLPSDNFDGSEDSDFDPMAVADELKGLDPDTARQVLVAQGYTPEEIKLVLGD